MARKTKSATGEPALSEKQVESYLKNHPNFLVEHPTLLDCMTPPMRWSGDKVVDLQSYMLDRLRGEKGELKDASNLLINTTRANMLIQTRTHASVIAIMNAIDLDTLVHVVCFDLPMLLDVDAVSLCLETFDRGLEKLASTDIRWFAPGTVNKVLGNDNEHAKLLEHTSDDGAVFGEASGIVRSAALARINLNGSLPNGLLALGSRNKGSFHGGQGTDLLLFLARVLEHCLRRCVPKPK